MDLQRIDAQIAKQGNNIAEPAAFIGLAMLAWNGGKALFGARTPE